MEKWIECDIWEKQSNGTYKWRHPQLLSESMIEKRKAQGDIIKCQGERL